MLTRCRSKADLMGDLRFRVANVEAIDPRVWKTAYISGMEGIPWYSHRRLEGDQFSIGRDIEESGKLNIVWPTKNLGNLCLSTTSLRVVELAYSLLVELARGTVYRMKNQCAEWQRIGLRLPTDFFPIAEQALNQFLKAVTSKDVTEQDAFAQAAIDNAVDASVLLCDAFSSQVLEIRQQNEGRFSTLLGCRIQPEISIESISETVKSAFNLISVEADLNSVETASGRRDYTTFDQQIAWAHENGLRVCVGPLVDFRTEGLPRWMVMLNEGFENVQKAVCQHAQETVERYRGKVHLWNCGTGLNSSSEMRWTDEEVLRMSVALIETVRRADDRTPVLLTIDQPWSEYLGDDREGISPLHFADALIRADLGLSGLGLQINLDTWPEGTLPRDPIEISRLVDRWGLLGLPLMLVLTHPTSTASDPNAVADRNVSGWSTGLNSQPTGLKADSLLRMLIAKPTVHAVIWNQLSDQPRGGLANAGLWDSQGKAKSLLSTAAKLKSKLPTLIYTVPTITTLPGATACTKTTPVHVEYSWRHLPLSPQPQLCPGVLKPQLRTRQSLGAC